MKSARNILILSETMTFVLVMLLLIFILFFLQMHIKSGYVNIQKQDITKVNLVIKAFIDKKYSIFSGIVKMDDKLKPAGFTEGFADVYYLNSGLKITSIIKKDRRSTIFRGYDFSTSKPAAFFRSVKSSVPVNSGIFISPETESPGIYFVSAVNSNLLVGRVDIEQLNETLKWFGEFSSNILILSTRDGYILSKTSEKINLQILPKGDSTEINLGEKYIMSKGRSEAIDCNIAALTPLSSVYNLIDSMKIYYPLLVVMIFTVIFLKTLIAVKYFVKPVESFLSILAGWVPGSSTMPVTGFLFRIKEISILFDTFRRKSEQITSGIIELKQKENEMQGMKNYLKNIIDSMPSIIISADKDGVITEWNTAAVRFTGTPYDKAVGRELFEVFPELNKIDEQYRRTLRTGYGFELKKGFNKDGNIVDMNVSVFPLSVEKNDGVVIRLDDITLFEKAENSLRQAQKMEVIGTLAGGLAHDFNNILAGIQGSISILKLKTERSSDLNELKPVYDKYFGYLEQSSERSAEIISRLIALSKKDESGFSKMDVNEIVSEVGRICLNSFDKSVEVVIDPYSTGAFVNGDATQLEQALLNLCVNGAHAMTTMRGEDEEKGGILSVSVLKIKPDQYFFKTHPESSPEIEYWSVSVKDSGVGMSKEVLAGIYDPFFTTKSKKGGTGLGLTMVYNIIQQHGGFIDVYTEKGKGSEFVVYLPVFTSADETGISEKTGAVRRGTGTILVIDDEEIIRKVSEELLAMCGFKVVTARDGFEGIEKFRENPESVNLVILDVIMPGISGIETYTRLKNIKSDVKVLLTSGFRHEEQIQEGMDLGINGFIQKPFTLAKLSDAVFKILEIG